MAKQTVVEALERQNALLQRLIGLVEAMEQQSQHPVVTYTPQPVVVTPPLTGPGYPTPRMIGQPDTISPDGVAVPGVVPGAVTAGGTPLVTALQQAAANAADQVIRQAGPHESSGRDTYPDGAAARFLDEQVHKVVKQGRGDGKSNV